MNSNRDGMMTLYDFAMWYADTQTGEQRLFSRSTIIQALPLIKSGVVSDTEFGKVSDAANAVIGLYKYTGGRPW